MKLWRMAAVSLAGVSAVVATVACGGGERAVSYTWSQRPLDAEMIFKRPEAPRDLRMFAGGDRNRLTWKDVMDAALWAEVVAVGVRPDDAVAQQTAAALVSDSLAQWPWTVVSIEWLDRSQQPAVDAWLAGAMTAEAFSAQVDPAGRWLPGWMPVLEAAKAAKTRVVAARAPQFYGGTATTQGWDALRRLPRGDQQLFAMPVKENGQKVVDFGGHALESTDSLSSTTLTINGVTQTVPTIVLGERWNVLTGATVADSIVAALQGANPRVIHIGSAEQTDFQGGVVRQLQARRPGTSLLTVSLVPRNEPNLQVDDFRRADVVIHSGI